MAAAADGTLVARLKPPSPTVAAEAKAPCSSSRSSRKRRREGDNKGLRSVRKDLRHVNKPVAGLMAAAAAADTLMAWLKPPSPTVAAEVEASSSSSSSSSRRRRRQGVDDKCLERALRHVNRPIAWLRMLLLALYLHG